MQEASIKENSEYAIKFGKGAKGHSLGLQKSKKNKHIYEFGENWSDKNEAAFDHILELVWCS